MRGLFQSLPPFAPDYSGVCSTIFDLGGLAVIYDAGGCTGTFTGYDEPRWFGSSSAIFCAGLREVDAVLGDDEKFLKGLRVAASTLDRRFIAVIGSPGPMVIGTDYQALASIASKLTGLPAMAFDTDGIQYYDVGVSLALQALGKTFVKPTIRKTPNTVNILGATPLDFGKGRQLKELISLLRHAGLKILSIWAMNSSLEKIAASAEASVNLVISRSGLEAARYLEKSFGMPYLVGVPVGRKQSTYLFEQLQGKSPSAPETKRNRRGKALVIGEQVLSNAIRNCLEMDFGVKEVIVASYFSLDDALRREGDVALEEERDLSLLTQELNFDIIIGDPLYRELVKEAESCRFLPVPHIALSSRLYWENEFSLIGENGVQMLQPTCSSMYEGGISVFQPLARTAVRFS
jgi:nitrogenase molybdenum-iron protein alpha/beta subunit